MKRWNLKFFLISIGILLVQVPAQGTVELGTDIFFSALIGFSDEIHLRTRSRVYVEVGDFAGGFVGRLEPQHSYLTDTTYGLGFRYGREFFIEADAGWLRRFFDGAVGTGSVMSVLVGWNIGDHFRLVIPITAKHVIFTSEDRWVVDYVPFFGVRFGF